MASCAATTDDGPCAAPAQEGSAYCYWHDPTKEAERREAASRGGRAPRGGVDLTKALRRPEILDDPMRIAALLETLIGGSTSGKVSPGQLRAVTAACRAILEALAAGDLRRDVDELKAAVKRMGVAGIRVEP